jgi:carboxymethylenebutenolidase
MIDSIEFLARSGEAASGELALAKNVSRAPGVIVMHEWWGLNEHIQSVLERLAQAGFAAMAPDLFHGVSTKDPARARSMMNGLDWSKAIDEVSGAASYLKTHPRVNGHVGIMGFCMGGALTLACGAKISEFEAVVPFYGIPPKEQVDYRHMKAPIQAHFSQRDEWAKPELAQELQQEIKSNGGHMELHLYNAEHAFFNDTRPEVYSAENAQLAWDRTVEFLRKALSR